MDEDRPTLGYRTPAAAPDAGPPSEVLGEFSAPMIGRLRLELGLGAPIRLSLDREELRLTPGSGLRLRSAALPPLLLRHVRLDLTRAEFEPDAVGLGAFEAKLVSIGLAAAFTHVLPWQPGRSIVDLAVQNLPQRADGRRKVFAAGPASVWLDPETRLDLAVGPEAAELSFTHAVYLRVLGLGIGLLAVRYLWGRQRVEIDGPPGQPLRNAMLRFVAWVASKWLRKRLPAALAAPGYDPFADPARREHFKQLAAAFARPNKPVPSDSQQSPVPSDSRPVASDSPTPPTSDGTPADAAATRAADAAVRDAAPEPSPTTSPRSPDDLVARLKSLKDLRLTPGPLPGNARMLAIVPLGERGSLALCTDRGQNLEIRRRGARIAIDAPAGLYVHAEQLPGADDLRLRHVAVGFGPFALEVTTSPALGSFTQAAIQQVGRSAVATRVPPATLARLEALGTGDELLRQKMGADASVTLTTPRDQEIVLRHAPDALELKIPAGLELKFEGLDFLPDATIKGLRYTWKTGELALDATPELGDLGNNFLSQLFRQRAARYVPPVFGVQGPDTSAPIDPAILESRPAVVFSHTVAAIGPMQVRLDPQDTIALSLSAAGVELNSGTGIALVMPELQVSLELKHFAFELAGRGLSADRTLGAYITDMLTRLLEKSALPPLQRRLPAWKPGRDPQVPWQLVRIDAGPLGPIDVNLGPGGAFVVQRDPTGLELRADPFLEIRAERQDFVPVLAFRKIRWEPEGDQFIVEFEPPVGPLVPELVQRLAHKFAPAATMAKVCEYAALPAPSGVPLPPALPLTPGTVVYETQVPQIGPVRVAADVNHVVDVSITRRAAEITFGTGVVARAPGLGFALQLGGVEVGLRPLAAHLDTKPEAGPLFDRVIEHALRGVLKEYADQFWPGDQAPRIGQDTLLVLGRGTAWGPLRVCVPTDGEIGVHLDKAGFAVRSEAGVFISGPAIDWLPDFYLHTLGYEFATGAVKLEISGIEETYYHEKHPVSPVTQALLAHLVKVLALPKLPAWTSRLGLQKFPLPPVPAIDARRIGMYKVALPGDFGEVMISMPPDDTVTVRIDDDEASVISDRGLFATLPGLRFELQLRGVRYHMHSGEIQVGGLGQLENALLEAVVARQLGTKVKPIAEETPGDVRPAVHTMLDTLPLDDQQRRVLFSHRLVNLLLPAEACLIMRFTADGLAFTADPPIKIDGPARIDYSFNGIRYSFADASFHLDLDNAGAVVSGLFTDFIIDQVEKRLNTMFKPMLPPPMREPGYSLATDPRSTEHIADIIENFTLFAAKKKKPAAAE